MIDTYIHALFTLIFNRNSNQQSVSRCTYITQTLRAALKKAIDIMLLQSDAHHIFLAVPAQVFNIQPSIRARSISSRLTSRAHVPTLVLAIQMKTKKLASHTRTHAFASCLDHASALVIYLAAYHCARAHYPSRKNKLRAPAARS